MGDVVIAAPQLRPDLVVEEADGSETWRLVAPGGSAVLSVPALLQPPASTLGARPAALPGLGPAPPRNPLRARLLLPTPPSPRGAQVSVAVRRAADVKPTFLQVKDVADLGGLLEAQSLLVPPRARVSDAWAATHRAVRPRGGGPPVASDKGGDVEPSERGYYGYQFEVAGLAGVIVAAARAGKVYVLAATQPAAAPTSRAADRAGGPAAAAAAAAATAAQMAVLRGVADSFRVTG